MFTPNLDGGGSGVAYSLVVLKPSTLKGYLVHFLQDQSGLGQAIANIPPLQRSLDVDQVQDVS